MERSTRWIESTISLLTMTIWTIQEESFLDELKRNGVVRRCLSNVGDEFRAEYRWMVGEMRSRGISIDPSTTPLWGWRSYDSANSCRPDLSDEILLEKGTKGVCLKLDVPANLVLLSQFEMWVWILNDWYIPFDEVGQIEAEKRVATEAEKLRSWRRIFELKWGAESFWKPFDQRGIQATIPRLEYSWVEEVECFLSN